MTDTKALNTAIESKGIKRSFLAENIGITRQSLSMKINGIVEFKASEIYALSKLLNLPPRDRDAIFFAHERELKSQN